MAGRAMMLGLMAMIAIIGWVVTVASWHLKQVSDGVRTPEDRSFERLQVLAIGTGGAYENPDRLGPCVGIGFGETVLLVDAGRAVTEALRSAQIPVSQPHSIYLTSLVGESVVGLDDLLLTGWLMPRREPLRIVGPPGTIALVRGIEQAHAAARSAGVREMGLPEAGARFEAIEAADGFVEEIAGIRVRAAELGGGPLPALAWRFEAANHSAVVGGVGWGEDALVALAKGADVLVQEAVHGASIQAAIDAGVDDAERLKLEAALHTDTAHVGVIAQRAGVRTLVLVRLRPPPIFDFQYARLVRESFQGNVVIADDGEEIATR